MNDFYDISDEKKVADGSPQLQNIGSQKIIMSYGKQSRSGWEEREYTTNHVYASTTKEDYDDLFASRISRIKPPYEIDSFLDHHYQHYLEHFPDKGKTFLKHMKYVIVPILQIGKHTVYVELLNEWLDAKSSIQSEVVTLNQNQAEFSHSEDTNPSQLSVNTNDQNQNMDNAKINDRDKVFISYSWDSKEHQDQVGAFMNHLRSNGFNAVIDKILSQQETAINFVKMMHKAMLEHPKVIVVLSKGYKQKAEQFVSGVGEEYELLINDIKTNPKKYILVSFEGRSTDIIPLGLQGREIIDLSKDGDDKLFRKLMDQDEYVISEVAPNKPMLKPKQFGNFREAMIPIPEISIEAPVVKWQSSQGFAGLYISIAYELKPVFKNISGKTVDAINYEIKFRHELLPDGFDQPDENGNLLIQGEYVKKVFPGQKAQGKAIDVDIRAQSLQQILGSHVVITAYTESGPVTSTFPVGELFKAAPLNEPYLKPGPLRKELFQNFKSLF